MLRELINSIKRNDNKLLFLNINIFISKLVLGLVALEKEITLSRKEYKRNCKSHL